MDFANMGDAAILPPCEPHLHALGAANAVYRKMPIWNERDQHDRFPFLITMEKLQDAWPPLRHMSRLISDTISNYHLAYAALLARHLCLSQIWISFHLPKPINRGGWSEISDLHGGVSGFLDAT